MRCVLVASGDAARGGGLACGPWTSARLAMALGTVDCTHLSRLARPTEGASRLAALCSENGF